MNDVMVTGRMTQSKKEAGNLVLEKSGLTASTAINLMYERLIEEQNADFLVADTRVSERDWRAAASFVDELVVPRVSRFHDMGKGEIKMSRYLARQA